VIMLGESQLCYKAWDINYGSVFGQAHKPINEGGNLNIRHPCISCGAWHCIREYPLLNRVWHSNTIFPPLCVFHCFFIIS
jgi:hypothetical protein